MSRGRHCVIEMDKKIFEDAHVRYVTHYESEQWDKAFFCFNIILSQRIVGGKVESGIRE